MRICFCFIFQVGEDGFRRLRAWFRRQRQRTLHRVLQLAERLLRLDQRIQVVLRAGGIFHFGAGHRQRVHFARLRLRADGVQLRLQIFQQRFRRRRFLQGGIVARPARCQFRRWRWFARSENARRLRRGSPLPRPPVLGCDSEPANPEKRRATICCPFDPVRSRGLDAGRDIAWRFQAAARTGWQRNRRARRARRRDLESRHDGFPARSRSCGN